MIKLIHQFDKSNGCLQKLKSLFNNKNKLNDNLNKNKQATVRIEEYWKMKLKKKSLIEFTPGGGKSLSFTVTTPWKRLQWNARMSGCEWVGNPAEMLWKPIIAQWGSLSAWVKRWRRGGVAGRRGRRQDDEEAQTIECEKGDGRKGKEGESFMKEKQWGNMCDQYSVCFSD